MWIRIQRQTRHSLCAHMYTGKGNGKEPKRLLSVCEQVSMLWMRLIYISILMWYAYRCVCVRFKCMAVCVFIAYTNVWTKNYGNTSVYGVNSIYSSAYKIEWTVIVYVWHHSPTPMPNEHCLRRFYGHLIFTHIEYHSRKVTRGALCTFGHRICGRFSMSCGMHVYWSADRYLIGHLTIGVKERQRIINKFAIMTFKRIVWAFSVAKLNSMTFCCDLLSIW